MIRARSDGTGRRARGLMVRVFAANLVVVAVAAIGALLAGWALSPIVLDRHMGMMPSTTFHGPGMQEMASDLEAAYRTALNQSLGWAALVATVAAAGVAWVVTLRLLAPLRALRSATTAFAAGRRGTRLDEDAPGELGDVAAAFNGMAEAIERGESERRRLVADLAHELRTPLSNLRGYVEALEDGVFEFDDATRAALGRQVERLERLVADLATLHDVEAGQVSLEVTPTDVAALAMAGVAAVQVRFADKGVALTCTAPPKGACAFADSVRVGQVLENLLANALRHTPAGGQVNVAVNATAEGVRVEVHDTGPGVPVREREAVFRRLYRGDPARGATLGVGSGVGLTIAKALVERQGGAIGVDEASRGGAAFWFTLPGCG
ncbi:MAG: HAMP domain-containing sensor histidine kinase [Trueperaceae bacterium]|nr:HAMP domain-containing sensor histidine kinase [Trueperaceae bacterium]